MQILHPIAGSVQQYLQQLADATHCGRPRQCPQCQAKHPLTAHGFYSRTLVDSDFDGSIRIRRYLCEHCQRTVSLLPEFALPYLRFSVAVIAFCLAARILHGHTLPPPYQRVQHWLRRFRARAASLCVSLSAITTPPPGPAANSFEERAVRMLNAADRTLQSKSWTGAHRFLFSQLRDHLLGWPPSLAPLGLCTAHRSAIASG